MFVSTIMWLWLPEDNNMTEGIEYVMKEHNILYAKHTPRSFVATLIQQKDNSSDIKLILPMIMSNARYIMVPEEWSGNSARMYETSMGPAKHCYDYAHSFLDAFFPDGNIPKTAIVTDKTQQVTDNYRMEKHSNNISYFTMDAILASEDQFSSFLKE